MISDITYQHWDYIKKLLILHGIDESILKIVEFHYISAFEHGLKHGRDE